MDALVVEAPSPLEFGMVGETLTVAAGILGDQGEEFMSVAVASPNAGNLIETLASASIWLASWARIVDVARDRLLASAPGGTA